MWSIKSEPSDMVDPGNDQQRIRHIDDNLRIGDIFNVTTSTTRFRPDESLNKEMLLTVAYVKTEQSTSYDLDYNTSSSNRNEDPHGQNLIATTVIKTEKTEACTNNTSGNMVDAEADMKEILQHNLDINHGPHISQHDLLGEIDIHHRPDISQHDLIGEIDINHRPDISQHDLIGEIDINHRPDISQHDLIGEIDKNYYLKTDISQLDLIKEHDNYNKVDISQQRGKSKSVVMNMEIRTRTGCKQIHQVMESKEKPY